MRTSPPTKKVKKLDYKDDMPVWLTLFAYFHNEGIVSEC